MSELFIDYSERKRLSQKRKQFLYIFGAVLSVGALVLLIYQLIDPQGLSLFISAMANLLLGMTLIIQAREPMFMSKDDFIRITPEFIEYKVGSFSRQQKMEWKTVDKITISKKSIDLLCDGQLSHLKMIYFTSSDEKRIRAAVREIAEASGK